MGRFARDLSSFTGMRVVVVGDVMLDEYVSGSVRRTSQEAPVMVVRKTGVETALGGAANVARNVCAFGGQATIVGVVGDDGAGDAVGRLAGSVAGLSARLVTDAGRPTTRKTRILATHDQQVVRIDEESCEGLSVGVESAVVARLVEACEGADVVLVSDYAKGVVSMEVAQAAVRAARDRGIPVVANIKPECPTRFAGADVVTLNRTECGRLTGIEPVGLPGGALAAEEVARRTGSKAVVVSLGAEGMSGWWGGNRTCVAAHSVEAYDPSGAGDTLLATLGLVVAGREISAHALELCSVCCGLVVRHRRVAVLSGADLVAASEFDAVLEVPVGEGYPATS